MNNTSITGFRTRIERHYELAKRILTPEEIAEAQRFEFQTKLSLRYNTVYKSIQRIYYIHLNHFGERDKRTLTDVVKLKTIIEAYEKIRNQKIITLLDERECAMCGAKFHPACEVRQVCDECLYRNNGNDYAHWYLERNPITITAESLLAGIARMRRNEAREIPMQSKSEAKARNY